MLNVYFSRYRTCTATRWPADIGSACRHRSSPKSSFRGADHAQTVGLHRRGLLAYYDYLISTGPLEGTHNKIKAMPRQNYGFRDHEFFELKTLALHQTRYALVG